MKKYAAFGSVLFLLFLSACSSGPKVGADLQEKLNNPLYAERYYDDFTDLMTNLEIQNDPLTKSGSTKTMVDKYRVDGLQLAREANQKQSEGISGNVISDYSYTTGNVLLLDNTLFFSSDFSVIPGPDLHVYMTKKTDPRDGIFPDETAVDLGAIKDPYGAQSYDVSMESGTGTQLQTAVIWDGTFNRIFGFAQLQKR